MPDRYHIHTVPTPAKFRRIGKFGNVDWREDCSRCTNCVKLRCLYDVYRHEAAYNRDPLAPVETWDECKACLSCVQGCTKRLLSVSVNPEFLDLGDEYWKPDILSTTWNQSDTGKIPVSGAGYRGRFHGPGFDSIWTDMSEIVRPTRDGIHGREYISTSVDIGRKPPFLALNGDQAVAKLPPLVSIPMPLIIDLSSPAHTLPQLDAIIEQTAADTGLIAIMDSRYRPADDANLEHIAFYLGPDSPPVPKEALRKTRLVEVADSRTVTERIKEIKSIHPEIVVAIRVELTATGIGRAIELAGLEAVEVVHVVADSKRSEERRVGKECRPLAARQD